MARKGWYLSGHDASLVTFREAVSALFVVQGNMHFSDTVTLGSATIPPMCTDMMVSSDPIRATDRLEEQGTRPNTARVLRTLGKACFLKSFDVILPCKQSMFQTFTVFLRIPLSG
jgi:hypothetical protein